MKNVKKITNFNKNHKKITKFCKKYSGCCEKSSTKTTIRYSLFHKNVKKFHKNHKFFTYLNV